MLLDQRFVPSLAFPSCCERDELTAEAAEIDAARDIEVYLGFARNTGLHIRRHDVPDVHADFTGSPPERQARFKDQPVSSKASGGANVGCVFDDEVDWDDDVRFSSMRLKALHPTGPASEQESAIESQSEMH